MSARRLVLVFPGIRGTSARTWFIGGSLAVHGLIALVVIVAPSLGSHKVPPMDVPVVSLAGSLPSAAPPASAPAPAPSPPVPAPPKPEPVKQPSPKTPSVPSPDKPKKDPPKKQPKPEPAFTPPSTGPTQPQSTGATGAPPGPPAPAAGGVTALDTGDPEFAWYRASVTAALRSRWTRPVIEDAKGTIAATVAFEIRRDGTVQNVRVESPSGVSVMDRSVLRAVIEASPLPPLPPSWREPTLSARFEFRWSPGDPD